jgi:hypothetical protein
MRKLILASAFAVGTVLINVVPSVALDTKTSNDDPCAGPRTEFMEGWCS